jgi:hypothetical protein
MAYLKDTTKLLANPGLRPGVRPQLLAAAPLIPYWKKLYVESSLTKYIIRKYDLFYSHYYASIVPSQNVDLKGAYIVKYRVIFVKSKK